MPPHCSTPRPPPGIPPLVVALDGVTDPRNLGAVVRSAAAFGAHGVVVPERRSAGMTAAAWKASAGAAVRLPVARVTNLTRALVSYQEAGCFVVGLDAGGSTSLPDLDSDLASGPLVVVIGSEGRGLSRLVAERCDLLVGIPMSGRDGVAQRRCRRRDRPLCGVARALKTPAVRPAPDRV